MKTNTLGRGQQGPSRFLGIASLAFAAIIAITAIAVNSGQPGQNYAAIAHDYDSGYTATDTGNTGQPFALNNGASWTATDQVAFNYNGANLITGAVGQEGINKAIWNSGQATVTFAALSGSNDKLTWTSSSSPPNAVAVGYAKEVIYTAAAQKSSTMNTMAPGYANTARPHAFQAVNRAPGAKVGFNNNTDVPQALEVATTA